MRSWQLNQAKARFTEFLNAALKKGPQVVTRRGIDAAVLVPIDEWRRMEKGSRLGIRSLLMGDGPRFENLIPPRRAHKRRRTIRLA
ncbi:MAG TPA: type II toxin-antitoxin system Phd/YefM family antitoxin [Candidatus Acidoferrales bacterium]|nr:type II toxin-antitoxin system Phd/YefM family antitoxin [Candidatus Acidoferrales bacterium]